MIMNDDKHMALVVLFEDLTTEKVNVDSLDEARYKAEKQYGDSIIDWYVVNARGRRLK
jgi:hypothetical protein